MKFAGFSIFHGICHWHLNSYALLHIWWDLSFHAVPFFFPPFSPNNLHPLKLYLYYYIVIVFYNVNLWRANLLFFFLLSLWKKKKKVCFLREIMQWESTIGFLWPTKVKEQRNLVPAARTHLLISISNW